MKLSPLWLLPCAITLLVIGRCSAPDDTDREREQWQADARRAVRHAEGKLKIVIDSLTEAGAEHTRRADSLAKVNRALFEQAESTPDTVTLPDTTASDSVRYWRARSGYERTQKEKYRKAYLGQIEVTISERLRAEAAETARDSLRLENGRLTSLLAQGVRLSEKQECTIVLGIKCPSRNVTGAIALVGGVLLGMELAN